jgi:hypothetical protein
MTKLLATLLLCLIASSLRAQQPVPVKPRVLISTDIGGSDPDDNQSLTHLLMYSDKFQIEGLVSSPSYGQGSKQEILRMIDLYEQDLPKLAQHQKGLATPRHLRSVTKQGRQGNAPYAGYTTATEGSEWIITCARRKSAQPLWILGWGGLEDLAQALHDAPDIQRNIRVYWIGGPNKKWSANSYAYIAQHFPNLWFIENNASYYGFFSSTTVLDSVSGSSYYDTHMRAAGHLGPDFKQYYQGNVKMGDTPSLLYLLDGDPTKPGRESWGGSFEQFTHSPRVVFDRVTTTADTVAFCTLVEFQLPGPEIAVPADSVCFWLETPYKKTVQKWPGYYLGQGRYGLKYVPKQAEVLRYRLTSAVPGFAAQEGTLIVTNAWPGKRHATDYALGAHWYTDKADPELYDGKIQGGKTVSKWHHAVLRDWAKRWAWLR